MGVMLNVLQILVKNLQRRILELETELRGVYISLEEDGYTVDWKVISREEKEESLKK